MIPRISTTDPTEMLTSAYYNEAKFVGKGGYYKGNKNYQCVNYAMGRTCELAKVPVTWYEGISTRSQIDRPMFNSERSGYGHAITWWDRTIWKKGSIPKIGSVMVYGSAYGSGCGHVRVVEKIENNKLFISGGNESGKMAFKWIDIPKVTSTGFLGYIYNPYVEEEDMSLIKFKLDKDKYEYKWSVDGNRYGEAYDVTTEKGFSDTKLEEQGYELILKVNGSLFYTYDKAHYACGLEKSRGVNNQEISMSCVSDYNTCMSIAGFEEDLYFASQQWVIDNMLDKSYCAITGLGIIMNGKKRNDMHKNFESQWQTKSGRTVIGEDSDGNFLSYSFEGETGKTGLTCAELQDKCLALGFVNAICLDGGGSVFRQYRNEYGKLAYDISSTRKVKNALMLYRKAKPGVIIETPTEPNDEQYNELLGRIIELECENFELIEKNDNLEVAINQLKKEKEVLANDNEQLKTAYNENLKVLKDAEEKIQKVKDILLNG